MSASALRRSLGSRAAVGIGAGRGSDECIIMSCCGAFRRTPGERGCGKHGGNEGTAMAQRPKNSSHNKKAPNATRAARGPVAWDGAVRRFKDHMIGPGEASRLTIDAYSRDLAGFSRWWQGARPDQELSPSAIL